jgi:hypothetical protein
MEEEENTGSLEDYKSLVTSIHLDKVNDVRNAIMFKDRYLPSSSRFSKK